MRVLILDDDDAFRSMMARQLTRAGLAMIEAGSIAEALAVAALDAAIIDLKIGQENGLHAISALRQRFPDARLLVLTGYASIATAVDAIKRGADDYLLKPINAAAVLAALAGKPSDVAPQAELPPSIRRVKYEHAVRVLAEVGGNTSEAARQLGIDRSTLYRMMLKKPGL